MKNIRKIYLLWETHITGGHYVEAYPSYKIAKKEAMNKEAFMEKQRKKERKEKEWFYSIIICPFIENNENEDLEELRKDNR